MNFLENQIKIVLQNKLLPKSVQNLLIRSLRISIDILLFFFYSFRCKKERKQKLAILT